MPSRFPHLCARARALRLALAQAVGQFLGFAILKIGPNPNVQMRNEAWILFGTFTAVLLAAVVLHFKVVSHRMLSRPSMQMRSSAVPLLVACRRSRAAQATTSMMTTLASATASGALASYCWRLSVEASDGLARSS